MLSTNRHLLISSLCCVLSLSAIGETAQEKGLAIAVESDKRDNGWVDSQAKMTMVLRNRQGKESNRKIRIKSKEMTNDGDKSLSIFDTPKDIRGTAMLTYSHINDADEQ